MSTRAGSRLLVSERTWGMDTAAGAQRLGQEAEKLRGAGDIKGWSPERREPSLCSVPLCLSFPLCHSAILQPTSKHGRKGRMEIDRQKCCLRQACGWPGTEATQGPAAHLLLSWAGKACFCPARTEAQSTSFTSVRDPKVMSVSTLELSPFSIATYPLFQHLYLGWRRGGRHTNCQTSPARNGPPRVFQHKPTPGFQPWTTRKVNIQPSIQASHLLLRAPLLATGAPPEVLACLHPLGWTRPCTPQPALPLMLLPFSSPHLFPQLSVLG